ncbi:hypothetical protein Hanom_Chr13g01217131 [Helianthus anomalus]
MPNFDLVLKPVKSIVWGLFGRREREKTNTLFITLRRHLVHLFSCRRLQMWSADCKPFASEKTNTTLMKM